MLIEKHLFNIGSICHRTSLTFILSLISNDQPNGKTHSTFIGADTEKFYKHYAQKIEPNTKRKGREPITALDLIQNNSITL
jgi:hypothetical protein